MSTFYCNSFEVFSFSRFCSYLLKKLGDEIGAKVFSLVALQRLYNNRVYHKSSQSQPSAAIAPRAINNFRVVPPPHPPYYSLVKYDIDCKYVSLKLSTVRYVIDFIASG